MLQRRFADSKGLLWFFDKNRPQSGVKATAPDNLFIRHRQYTFQKLDGTRDWSLEERYSRLEGCMNLLIEKIVPQVVANQYPILPPSERELLDLFVYEQWRRVPELYERMISDAEFMEMIRDTLDEYADEVRPLSTEERESFCTPAYLKAQRKNTRVLSLLRRSGSVLGALSRKGLFFARTPRNRSFLLGSFPVSKLTPNDRPALYDPEVEVWLPIDPNVAIVLAAHRGVGSVFQVEPTWIRTFNLATARNSQIFAGRDEALVRSIARSFRHRSDYGT